MNYYNDNDPNAAAWLRQLIADGLIPDGEVDERSISDVRPIELVGYTQCHFFAGVGGWALALALAGWPAKKPVWTGSVPCQPFSNTGLQNGFADERHLWPSFYWLIAQCRPAVVFGEQVATKSGRDWFAGIRTDLEIAGYKTGAADLCAASIGAPHIRQRLYWVAHSDLQRRETFGLSEKSERKAHPEIIRCSEAGGLGLPVCAGLERHARHDAHHCEQQQGAQQDGSAPAPGSAGDGRDHWDDSIWIECADGKRRRVKPGLPLLADGVPDRVALIRGYGNAIVPQLAAQFIIANNDILQGITP